MKKSIKHWTNQWKQNGYSENSYSDQVLLFSGYLVSLCAVLLALCPTGLRIQRATWLPQLGLSCQIGCNNNLFRRAMIGLEEYSKKGRSLARLKIHCQEQQLSKASSVQNKLNCLLLKQSGQKAFCWIWTRAETLSHILQKRDRPTQASHEKGRMLNLHVFMGKQQVPKFCSKTQLWQLTFAAAVREAEKRHVRNWERR